MFKSTDNEYIDELDSPDSTSLENIFKSFSVEKKTFKLDEKYR